jgi:MFS family permease
MCVSVAQTTRGQRDAAVRGHAGRSPAQAVVLAGTATVACLVPVFLTGALAIPLREELGFGTAALGLGVGLFRAAAAVVSPVLGGVADRLGAVRALRLATAVAGLCSFGIAATADRWGVLVAWLMVGGCAAALGQPAANRLLSNGVPANRLGLAFGVKQSAPPMSSLLAGISLPVVALTLGWRWAYVLAGLLALAVAVTIRSRPQGSLQDDVESPSLPPPPPAPRGRLIVLLATAFGLGTFTSAAITTFFVDAAVLGGSTQQFAGSALALISLAAIATRVASGAVADRMEQGHLRWCAALLAAGAGGTAILAFGGPIAMVVGGGVGLAGSWGFNGVLLYALVRTSPDSPGRITGMVAPGALLGASLGPLVFGVLVEATGYGPAWLALAGVALLAAITMAYGGRRLAAQARDAGVGLT